MSRGRMKTFASGDPDHICLTHTPQGRGVADGEKIAGIMETHPALIWDSLAIRILSKHDIEHLPHSFHVASTVTFSTPEFQ
jgi:hypothetical protein